MATGYSTKGRSFSALRAPASTSEVIEVWFAIRGANLNLDEEGNVESVLDAGAVLEIYQARCEKGGHGRPNVIGT